MPLKTADWDKGALFNLRSFWLPTEYDYSLLKDDIPVFLVLGETDPLTASGGIRQHDSIVPKVMFTHMDERQINLRM